MMPQEIRICVARPDMLYGTIRHLLLPTCLIQTSTRVRMLRDKRSLSITMVPIHW